VRPTLYFFLLLGLIFATLECKNKTVNPGPKPERVLMVPGSADSSAVEEGIDAIPEGDRIHVEWIASPDDNVTSYELYRRDDRQAEFVKVTTVQKPSRQYDDSGPVLNVRFWYYVVAVTFDGLRSDPSDTLSYKLIVKPDGLTPAEVAGARPEFTWRDPSSANYYIFKIRERGSDTPFRITRIQSVFGDNTQVFQFDSLFGSGSESLGTGRYYEWRIDVVGNEPSCGSESRWVMIQIQ
jgi:hypothetical protein